MIVNLNLTQADNYAIAYKIFEQVLFSLREKCQIKKSHYFGAGDALDILNGYGHNGIPSSRILELPARPTSDWSDPLSPEMVKLLFTNNALFQEAIMVNDGLIVDLGRMCRNDEYWEEFQISIGAACWVCRVVWNKEAMLSYAHGFADDDGKFVKDLKVAYRYRKTFYSLLDNLPCELL